MKHFSLPLMALLGLVACSGGSASLSPAGPTVVVTPEISTPAFETYTTKHNGRNRVSLTHTASLTTDDRQAIAAFDRGSPSTPAGYKDLVALNDSKMTIEVLAKVNTGVAGAPAERILRLTVDQAPLQNIKNGRVVAASGQYHFRGSSFAWVTIDNGPLLSGSHNQGLTSLVLDFGKGTADISLRTEVNSASQVEISLAAKDLPFNIISGAYGGGVDIAVRNPGGPETYTVAGQLRGNVGGSPTYANSQHGMSTSGLFTATGTDGGVPITVDGAYQGLDPNAKP